MRAFSSGPPPLIASTGARARPSSAGSSSYSLRCPSISITCEGPLTESSSMPSPAWKTIARSTPSRMSTSAIFPATVPSATPSAWYFAPAGLVSGPSMLNTVRTPISRRGTPAKRMAGWKSGANMKPMPASSMHRATPLGRQVDLDAERLEDVGRAAHRRGGAVAVLGDARAAGRGDDQRDSVEMLNVPRAVAAGPARVDAVCAVDADRRRQRAHRSARGRRSPRPSRPSCAGAIRKPAICDGVASPSHDPVDASPRPRPRVRFCATSRKLVAMRSSHRQTSPRAARRRKLPSRSSCRRRSGSTRGGTARRRSDARVAQAHDVAVGRPRGRPRARRARVGARRPASGSESPRTVVDSPRTRPSRRGGSSEVLPCMSSARG